MEEKYKIEIESKGEYETKKEFNKQVMMTEDQWLAFLNAMSLWLQTNKIKDYVKPQKI